MPTFCAGWCAVWFCHAEVGLDSSSCLTERLEFVVSTSLRSAHISLNLLWHLSTRIPLRRRCRGWSSTAADMSRMSFPPPLERWTQRITQLTSIVSSPYALLRRPWISITLKPSAGRNSIATLCLVRTSTISTTLHCYCVQRTWLTGAPVTLAQKDGVTGELARQETLRAPH